ncbi:MAG TPA: hypothetical protein VN969_33450 [Streptosporangiaceae bacterium]|nr:hypothetical protein [Streptosporangiaceae bacterium]
MTVTPADVGASTLALTVVYRLPSDVVGAGLDPTVLRGVATATVRASLNRGAEAIQ